MSLFKNKIKYKTPERLTPSEARERRLTGMLEREQRFAQVPNFSNSLEALRSQAQKEKQFSALTSKIVNERSSRVQKAASIAAALNTFQERDFANPEARAAYRNLRAAAAALQQKNGSSQKVPPSGGNKSYYNPAGKDYANTIYGTAARITGWTQVVGKNNWQPRFARPSAVLPCIQRLVRREVMFAQRHAGKGYRVKHRRNWSSGIPC